MKLRLKVITTSVLQAHGVCVSNKENFLIDIDHLCTECEHLFAHASSTLLSRSPTEACLSAITGLMNSLLKQLDRMVTETSGCDSYINRFVTDMEKLSNKLTESTPAGVSLARKFKFVAANAWLKLKDYDRATSLIQSCCQLIQKGDRDELKVYLLAFKMHCQLRDKNEANEMFT